MSYFHFSSECDEHHDLVRDFGPWSADPWAKRSARPEIVCLCGSTRFIDTWNEWRRRLTNDGLIVLAIEVVTTQSLGEDPQHVDPALKARLDELHKRKIDLADRVLILNVGGYIGESTRSEIAYAERIDRPVDYLEPLDARGQAA